ncbi:MAG: CvpA family protein [Planctomycetes bacterium]|nr:CvpA family protein [Planctomycetota bacterium]
MALDIFCVLVLAFLTITGYWAGVIRQVLLLACLIGSFALSREAVGPINRLIAPHTALSPSASYVLSGFLAWLAIYVILRLIAFYIDRVIGKDRIGQVRPWNKKLGAALGAVKGLILVSIILCGLDVALGVAVQEGKAGTLYRMYQSSYSGALMSKINPLAKWRVADRVHTLIEVARNPAVLKGMENEAYIRKIINHPKVRAVTQNPQLDLAVKKRDFLAIWFNKDVQALLSDPEIARLLLNEKIFDILEKRVEQSKLPTKQGK